MAVKNSEKAVITGLYLVSITLPYVGELQVNLSSSWLPVTLFTPRVVATECQKR